MKCAICRNGTTTDGYTTIVLERDQTTVVFKKVPAQICDHCGEEYVSAAVNTALLHQAHEEWKRGIILEMPNFAAQRAAHAGAIALTTPRSHQALHLTAYSARSSLPLPAAGERQHWASSQQVAIVG